MSTQINERIAKNLAAVRVRIADAARRAGRSPDSVALVLATKTQTVDAIRAAYAAGAREFGENYVQEAAAKRGALPELADARWHLIGHLQSNKVRKALETFDVIQTLDSEGLGAAIGKARPSPRFRVMIEVNVAEERSKSGAKPSQVERLIEAVRDQVEVLGLMAIPPVSASPEQSRPYFAALRSLRDRVAASTGLALSELSMGMTDDFEVGVEEGATIARVGRAVFGDRPK